LYNRKRGVGTSISGARGNRARGHGDTDMYRGRLCRYFLKCSRSTSGDIITGDEQEAGQGPQPGAQLRGSLSKEVGNSDRR